MDTFYKETHGLSWRDMIGGVLIAAFFTALFPAWQTVALLLIILGWGWIGILRDPTIVAVVKSGILVLDQRTAMHSKIEFSEIERLEKGDYIPLGYQSLSWASGFRRLALTPRVRHVYKDTRWCHGVRILSHGIWKGVPVKNYAAFREALLKAGFAGSMPA